MLGLAFPITRFDDTETAYLDLLSSVLGGGESSRLYRDVKDRQQLVHSVSASAYTPLDAGLFFVDATLEPENLEAALAAIARRRPSRVRPASTATTKRFHPAWSSRPSTWIASAARRPGI
jgi:zinc protease